MSFTPPSVQFLKGIGPKKAAVLSKYGIHTVYDLLLYVPRRYLDRSQILTIAEVRRLTSPLAVTGPPVGDAVGPQVSRDVTVVGEVRSFNVAGVGRKARFVLVLADATGSMQLVWFGGVTYWKRAFAVGDLLAVSGEPVYYRNTLQIVHPDLDRLGKSGAGKEPDLQSVNWGATLNTGGLVPLYPSGQELSAIGFDSAGFRRTIHEAIGHHLSSIPDPLPLDLRRTLDLPPLQDAIRSVHFPRQRQELERSLRRLKYEELFLFQMKLALRKRWLREQRPGVAFDVRSSLARRLVDTLPFALTKAQVRVINEITADMKGSTMMNRLLQGDVGSGKTIVALITMLIAVDNGYQAVLMAPTEILAEQHYRTLADRLETIGVHARLLVGSQRTTLRRDILDDVARGSAQIVVGTHALFEKDVTFAHLGLVVIDEQHRFGVAQRSMLHRKGRNPDILVMTATPIPRTLSLTLYGDLDVSVIDELPAGRRPVATHVRRESDKEAVYAFVREQIRAGRQAYFVYPLIEESEKVDLKAATVHFEQLRDGVFPGVRLGLIHGRLPADEKDAVMRRFKRHETDILVATTVIEVGIDVPNATVMVIENAERFGLSQLHQLRGRVGRGSDQSYCILLAPAWTVRKAGRIAGGAGKERLTIDEGQAERRLATMAQTSDGFRIAEVDLELRGPGDYFGTRQSGMPEFRVADLLHDTDLLHRAREDAFTIVTRDPHLRLPGHAALASLLRSVADNILATHN